MRFLLPALIAVLILSGCDTRTKAISIPEWARGEWVSKDEDSTNAVFVSEDQIVGTVDGYEINLQEYIAQHPVKSIYDGQSYGLGYQIEFDQTVNMPINEIRDINVDWTTSINDEFCLKLTVNFYLNSNFAMERFVMIN